MLDDSAVGAGYRLIVYETLGSTNQEALSRGRAGEDGRLWLQARAQTEGRGRKGRAWSSPAGNLYTTLLLVDPAEPRRAAEIGFVAGLALARAVRRLPGMPDDVRIKWPNDLVCRGAKLAGILVEGTQRPDNVFACAIGFGVNCVSHPTVPAYPTTDLSAIAAREISATSVLNLLSSEMVAALALWDKGMGFVEVRDAWLGLALPAGSALTVTTPSSTTQGLFDTIDQRGRLVLRTVTGLWTVEAADVFLTGRDLPTRSQEG